MSAAFVSLPPAASGSSPRKKTRNISDLWEGRGPAVAARAIFA
jgi:hypothetical protein